MTTTVVTVCDGADCGEPITDKEASLTVEVLHEGGESPYRYDRGVWHYHKDCVPTKISEFELAQKAKVSELELARQAKEATR